jgi:hypothetical protein
MRKKLFLSEKNGFFGIKCTAIREFFILVLLYHPPFYHPEVSFPGAGVTIQHMAHFRAIRDNRYYTYVSWLSEKIEFLLIKPLYYSFNCRACPPRGSQSIFTFQETGFNKKKNSLLTPYYPRNDTYKGVD